MKCYLSALQQKICYWLGKEYLVQTMHTVENCFLWKQLIYHRGILDDAAHCQTFYANGERKDEDVPACTESSHWKTWEVSWDLLPLANF